MIKVTGLTKKYGNNTAVDNISFEVEKGRIYGFLGPNGAGKSTTMNIITGCLAATAGTVTIDGHDIYEAPIMAKKLIGYLPELPPLYTDMTPREYLSFVAQAKGIKSSEVGPEVQRVIEKASLEAVKNRLIRNLSKGYRQRVGIAMALLGDPEIIILDEPTVGLDPRQIIEIRELIKSLGEDHTVILSSHILSEIQEVCERVIIISRGHVVANDTLDNIVMMGNEYPVLNITAKCSPETAVEIIDSYEEVTHYAITEGKEGTDMVLTLEPGFDIREKLCSELVSKGIAVLYLSNKQSLEEIYLKLTEATLDSDVEEDIYEESILSSQGSDTEEDSAKEQKEEEYVSMLTEEDNEDEGDL